MRLEQIKVTGLNTGKNLDNLLEKFKKAYQNRHRRHRGKRRSVKGSKNSAA